MDGIKVKGWMDGRVETGTCQGVVGAVLTGRLSERIALGQEHAPPIHSLTHSSTHSLIRSP
jgi:hypothetical protein